MHETDIERPRRAGRPAPRDPAHAGRVTASALGIGLEEYEYPYPVHFFAVRSDLQPLAGRKRTDLKPFGAGFTAVNATSVYR